MAGGRHDLSCCATVRKSRCGDTNAMASDGASPSIRVSIFVSALSENRSIRGTRMYCLVSVLTATVGVGSIVAAGGGGIGSERRAKRNIGETSGQFACNYTNPVNISFTYAASDPDSLCSVGI